MGKKHRPEAGKTALALQNRLIYTVFRGLATVQLKNRNGAFFLKQGR